MTLVLNGLTPWSSLQYNYSLLIVVIPLASHGIYLPLMIPVPKSLVKPVLYVVDWSALTTLLNSTNILGWLTSLEAGMTSVVYI